jgi:GNAT superfamily N-acetyltransferase
LRTAAPGEGADLEAMQRRSSGVWEQYREQLRAHPDAIEMPSSFIASGWVRVAVTTGDVITGFSVVIPRSPDAHELDGLFVEPDHMRRGIGRMLVGDACRRARAAGAEALDVIAGPAQGFYEKVGFRSLEAVQTRFGPAVRMRKGL